MDKNIYIELANTLDSAGLYRESDELMEVISSNTSMIKTAQSGELSKCLSMINLLTGWSWLIASAVGGAIPPALATAITNYKIGLKNIDNQYKRFEMRDEPLEFYAKTIDPVLYNKLKAEATAAKSISNQPKENISVYIPTNNAEFDINDPNSYRLEEYKILKQKTIGSNGKTLKNPIANPLINKFLNPDNYISIQMDGDQEVTKEILTPKPKQVVPEDLKNQAKDAKKENIKNTFKKSGIAFIIGGLIAGTGYQLVFNRKKSQLKDDINAQFTRYKLKYSRTPNKDKTPQLKVNLVQELSNQLDNLLGIFDGKQTGIHAPDLTKEELRDCILKVFKKEIGYGVSSGKSDSTRSTANPPQSSRSRQQPPSTSTPRKQDPRTTAPSSGGSTGVGVLKRQGL